MTEGHRKIESPLLPMPWVVVTATNMDERITPIKTIIPNSLFDLSQQCPRWI
ncbi:hypothetical protein [Paraburkholderia sp. GAS42]|jgi:hypothetical protein|uniref:hypothetical protein n=1 Tax=Paraburkholderia sp. GAS42 TaxID=3035135 RepID=UPI003D24AD0E